MNLLSGVPAAVFLAASLQAQLAVPSQDVRNVFPADARVEQFALTMDGGRTYYTTPNGELWMYDRGRNAASRIATQPVWDLTVSHTGAVLAYTKPAAQRRDQHVWLLPLSPATGLPNGPERRISAQSGDVPSISPDGEWVAFARDDPNGVGQSVVIVPTKAGTERVVAPALPSGVSGIRWAPDGKTLYFGVNSPVPFTCAESCITLARDMRPPPGTIRRVAVQGGPVEVVVAVGNPLPGLSPDGTLLVYRDTGAAALRRFVVADANGRRLETFTPPTGQTPQGWTRPTTLLTATSGAVRRLSIIPLPAGTPRNIWESSDFALEPSWSADGGSVSVLRFVAGRCELRVMKPDGSGQRAIPFSTPACANSAWTADQRSLVFVHYRSEGRPMLTTLDVASAQTKDLREIDVSADWVLDRDVVILVELVGSGVSRRAAIRQIDLAGHETLLKELPLEPGGSVVPIDRTAALVMRARPREFRLVSLESGGGERVLLPPRAGFIHPRVSFSADHQWAAFRISPVAGDNTQLKVLELVRLDGSARHTIELPFSADAGTNPVILPGASAVVLSERRRQDALSAVYVVDVGTQAATKLFSYVPTGRFPEIAASPDGRALVFLVTESPPPTLTSMDLSTLRGSGRP
jgi:Tol biopolymer transport system component